MSSATRAHNGLPGPDAGSPVRAPGSIRRTSNVDLARDVPPDAVGEGTALGPDVTERSVTGRARDLITYADGTSSVLDRAMMSVVIGPERVAQVSTFPQHAGTSQLVGRPPLLGWRTGLWRFLRDQVEAGTALHQILDDVPGLMVIGGYSGNHTEAPPSATPAPRRLPPPRPRLARPLNDDEAAPPEPPRRLDVCAGWAAESRAARIFAEHGTPPPPVAPLAPPLFPDDDPLAWHTIPPLGPAGMSRRRRLDVRFEHGGIVANVLFRDTFLDIVGSERVLHEYLLDVLVDPDTLMVEAIRTDPHVLPHTECPLAQHSAQRLVGAPVLELRDRVSAELFGPSSCTHLNDVLRGLTDIPALAARLR